jgi:hypothetical protein
VTRVSRSRTPRVPLGRGRALGLHVHTINDRFDMDNGKRLSRLPDGRVYLHASILRDPPPEELEKAVRRFVREHDHGEPGFEDRLKREMAQREHDLGTILKGWYRVGWSRYRFRTVEVEFAIGGEDNQVQVGVRTPLAAGAIGVKVPRAWTRGWVYHRREWAIKLGYIGSIAWVAFAHDSHMESTGMDDYYRRMRERGEPAEHVTDAMLWNGWEHYIGGTFIPGRIVNRVLGKTEVTKVVIEEARVPIEMDGTVYWAEAQRYDDVRKRKRRPANVTRYVGLEFNPPDTSPPQFAGKGENSWDCGDDGIYGCSYETDSFSEAVRRYVAEVEKYRKQYGMPSGLTV